MSEESKGLLQFFGAQFAGLFLFVLVPMPGFIFLAAIAMLLWPFALLIHWHCLSPEQRQRLTTPPKPVERKPAGRAKKIFASAFFAAMAVLSAMVSVLIFLTPKPDYYGAVSLAFCAVVFLGFIRWIWRPGWTPA